MKSAEKTDRPARRSRRVAWTAGAAAVVAVLGAAFTYFNSNILAPDRVCHGWVTTDEAAAALGGGLGRVSASDDSDATCTIRMEGWLPGHDRQLNLSGGTEQATFPFSKGAWRISGAQHALTGGTHGAYDGYGGWALLPPACKKHVDGQSPTPVLQIHLVKGRPSSGDADSMGRLLTSAAASLANGPAGCSASGYGDTPTRDAAPSPERTTDLDEACGIAGYRLGAVHGPKGERVRERVTGSLRHGLYCDLSFDGDEEGSFAHLAVVKDPALVTSLRDRDVTRARCDGQETAFVFDFRHFDQNERAATGLPDTAGFARTFSEAARTAADCG